MLLALLVGCTSVFSISVVCLLFVCLLFVCCLFVVCLFVCCLLFVVRCLLFVVCCCLLFVVCLFVCLFVVCCSLFVVCCLLSVVCCLLSAFVSFCFPSARAQNNRFSSFVSAVGRRFAQCNRLYGSMTCSRNNKHRTVCALDTPAFILKSQIDLSTLKKKREKEQCTSTLEGQRQKCQCQISQQQTTNNKQRTTNNNKTQSDRPRSVLTSPIPAPIPAV